DPGSRAGRCRSAGCRSSGQYGGLLSTPIRCVVEVSGMMLIMWTALGRMSVVVLLGVVVGCGGGHGSSPNTSSVAVGSPTVTVASSGSHSASPAPGYPADVPLTGHNVKPGEKPPVYPAAAKVRSQAGANAFAE